MERRRLQHDSGYWIILFLDQWSGTARAFISETELREPHGRIHNSQPSHIFRARKGYMAFGKCWDGHSFPLKQNPRQKGWCWSHCVGLISAPECHEHSWKSMWYFVVFATFMLLKGGEQTPWCSTGWQLRHLQLKQLRPLLQLGHLTDLAGLVWVYLLCKGQSNRRIGSLAMEYGYEWIWYHFRFQKAFWKTNHWLLYIGAPNMDRSRIVPWPSLAINWYCVLKWRFMSVPCSNSPAPSIAFLLSEGSKGWVRLVFQLLSSAYSTDFHASHQSKHSTKKSNKKKNRTPWMA